MSRLRRTFARVQALLDDPRRRGIPLTFSEPCYWIIDRLSDQSVMLDFGLGFDADFSQAMIGRYGLRSFGFEPTQRHHAGLQEVVRRMNNRLVIHPWAIGGKTGTALFHESQQNVSGSMLADHWNIQRDTVKSYEVRVATITESLEVAPGARADLVKMDIEGSEYEAIDGTPSEILQRVDQWVIEFHHDYCQSASFSKTRRTIRLFKEAGFDCYTWDNINFLLYKRSLRA
ncbi:MAG: FkbM family methyltransferase [Planctomycetota bacterium]|nr:FkbM family methyltransferase [Planctomycetota bacterium]